MQVTCLHHFATEICGEYSGVLGPCTPRDCCRCPGAPCPRHLYGVLGSLECQLCINLTAAQRHYCSNHAGVTSAHVSLEVCLRAKWQDPPDRSRSMYLVISSPASCPCCCRMLKASSEFGDTGCCRMLGASRASSDSAHTNCCAMLVGPGASSDGTHTSAGCWFNETPGESAAPRCRVVSGCCRQRSMVAMALGSDSDSPGDAQCSSTTRSVARDVRRNHICLPP